MKLGTSILKAARTYRRLQGKADAIPLTDDRDWAHKWKDAARAADAARDELFRLIDQEDAAPDGEGGE
jgi:hypothetical protein